MIAIKFEFRIRYPLEPFVPQPLAIVHVRLGRLDIAYRVPEWLGNLLKEREYGKGWS